MTRRIALGLALTALLLGGAGCGGGGAEDLDTEVKKPDASQQEELDRAAQASAGLFEEE